MPAVPPRFPVTPDDIARVVARFYAATRGHEVLGPAGTRPIRCLEPTALQDWRPWIEAAIPLRPDDEALRGVMARPLAQRGPAFEALRRNYALRRELSSFRIDQMPLDPATHERLTALGIAMSPPPASEASAPSAR